MVLGLLLIISIFIDFQHVFCLFVEDIYVPDIADFRNNVTLACHYDLNNHVLNSVKWYKDKREFFRYSPFMHPEYMKFSAPGINVQEGKYNCSISVCRVEISLAGAKASGVFECEVSEDAPHFKLDSKAANMTVAALPQSNPLIENFNSMYKMDDFLSATCASDYSSLPTKLTWYINGEKAQLNELQPSVDKSLDAHDFTLHRQNLQLQFYLSGPRFYNAGKLLELKCVAEIENFPELRRETALTATLLQYDNLNNQMLIHASVGGAEARNSQLISAFLVATQLFMAVLLCLL